MNRFKLEKKISRVNLFGLDSVPTLIVLKIPIQV